MTPTRLVASSVLVLAVIWLAAPLLADDCDEDCGRHCGDCAWCPLAADLSTVDHAVSTSATELPSGPDRSSQPDVTRALDHVPLLAT